MSPLEIALYSPLVKVSNSASYGKALDHPFKNLPDMGNHSSMWQAKGYAMPGVMDYGADYMKLHSVGGFPGFLAKATRFLLPPKSRAGAQGFNPFSGVDMNNPVNRFYAAGARATGHMLNDRYRNQLMMGGNQGGLWQALPSLLQLLG